jgi:serine/threonine-protein kinase
LIRLAARIDDLIGRQLDGRYEIRAPLGRGGMGTVYRGWQLSVDREVAIKVVSPKLASDRNAVKRFLREARLASRLSQPNVVNVYDFGQADNILYLVMELLRGHTLQSELGSGRRINPKRTVTIAAQLCDALEAAHAQGIIHRDLKPGNIVVLDDPPGRDLIKVLDFGLAKSLVQDSGSAVTNSDALLGTPLYMAPEQIDGRDTDQRVDLYALGCILYEMLSGRPPFVDTAVSAVLSRHLNDAPEQLAAHVPPKLRSLVDQLLAKKPDDRVQTAGEVHALLDQIREAVGARANTPLPFDTPDTSPDVNVGLAETAATSSADVSAARASAMAATAAAAPSVVAAPRNRRGVLAMRLAVVAVLGGGIIAWFATRSGGGGAVAARDAGTAAVAPAEAAMAMTVDAGVPVDAAPPDAAAVVDAHKHDAPRAVKKRDAGDVNIDFHN